MILSIKTLGDTTLREKAQPVTSFDDELLTLVDSLFETMEKQSGVGIAAPQVGVSKRVFVCAPPGEDSLVCVNPTIVQTSQSVSLFEEGCLSVPGVFSDIERPDEIVIHYQDVKGKSRTLQVGGYLARIIQHEYDHLEGKLFIDRIENPRVYDKLMKKYNKRQPS